MQFYCAPPKALPWQAPRYPLFHLIWPAFLPAVSMRWRFGKGTPSTLLAKGDPHKSGPRPGGIFGTASPERTPEGTCHATDPLTIGGAVPPAPLAKPAGPVSFSRGRQVRPSVFFGALERPTPNETPA